MVLEALLLFLNDLTNRFSRPIILLLGVQEANDLVYFSGELL